MAEHSAIEWTDATWNPITGCSVISPGCTNCYAMRLAGTRLKHHPSRKNLTRASKAGPVWTGEVRFNQQWIEQPLGWAKPCRVFVCAHGDLFHEDVPVDWIAWVYGVAIAAVHLRGHTFQVLTKRAERAQDVLTSDAFWDQANAYAADYVMERVDALDRRRGDARATLDDYDAENPPPGIWLGVSAEDQPRADERVPVLLATPAAVRFVSYEPALGPVDFTPYLFIFTHEDDAILEAAEDGDAPVLPWRDPATTDPDAIITPRLDWVICGGENGDRPMHPDWARLVRDQCALAQVPFFFKQWGSWATVYDRDRDDADWRRCPTAKHHGERYLNLAGGHGFHGERVVFVRKIGKAAQGWDVISKCRHCELTMQVDLALIAKVSGPGTLLWNRTARCRRLHCTGVVDFMAKAPGMNWHEKLLFDACEPDPVPAWLRGRKRPDSAG